MTLKDKTTYVLNFGHNLPINELAQLFIQTEKETVPNLITIIRDYLIQAGGAQNFIFALFNRELTQRSLAMQWYSSNLARDLSHTTYTQCDKKM